MVQAIRAPVYLTFNVPPAQPKGSSRGPPRPSRGAHPAQGVGIFKAFFFLLELEKWDPDLGWAFSNLFSLREFEKLDPGIFHK